MSSCRRTALASESLGVRGSSFVIRRSRTTSHERRITRSRGFSLLELLIVVSLLGLFMGAVQEAVIVGLRATSAADKREEIRQQLAGALDHFTREAAMADNVDVATSTRFQFDTPALNNNNYVYDGTTQTLSHDDAASPNRVIVRNLTAFDFDYVDCVGTSYTGTVPGSAEDTLRVVQVTATVTKDNETISVAKSIFLRNLLGQIPATCGTL